MGGGGDWREGRNPQARYQTRHRFGVENRSREGLSLGRKGEENDLWDPVQKGCSQPLGRKSPDHVSWDTHPQSCPSACSSTSSRGRRAGTGPSWALPQSD